MKKIIYSLVIMIAAGSLFTSCIEQVEPEGIRNMRDAKAEYIRSLKDVNAADAEFRRAEAEVERAKSRLIDAKAATEAERANKQKMLNEYQQLLNEAEAMNNEQKAAEIAKEIARIELEMEQLKRAAELQEIQDQIDLAAKQKELDEALRNLEFAANDLTDNEKKALIAAAGAYYAAGEALAVKKAEVAAYQMLIDSLNAAKADLTEAASMKWDEKSLKYVNYVEYFESRIAAEKAKIAEYEAKLAATPEPTIENIDKWAEEVKAYEDSVKQIKLALANVEKEAAAYYGSTVHEGVKKYNQAIDIWMAEHQEFNYDEDGKVILAPATDFDLAWYANEPKEEDYTKAYAFSVEPLEYESSATYDRFKYMLVDEGLFISPIGKEIRINENAWINYNKSINGKERPRSQMISTYYFKDFILGDETAEIKTVDTLYVQNRETGSGYNGKYHRSLYNNYFHLPFESPEDTLIVTTDLKAKYGLKGALSVLKRSLVTKEESKESQEKLDTLLTLAKEAWTTNRAILVDSLLKNYGPYKAAIKKNQDAVDTLKAAKAADTKVANDMIAAIEALDKFFKEEGNGITDLTEITSTLQANPVFDVISAFAKAREALDYEYVEKDDQNKVGNTKVGNKKLFYYSTGKLGSDVNIASVKFSEMTKADVVNKESKYRYQFNDATLYDGGDYSALAYMAYQLFGSTKVSDITSTANLNASNALYEGKYAYTPANEQAEPKTKAVFAKEGKDSYTSNTTEKAEKNISDGAKGTQQAVRDSIKAYIEVYNNFWALKSGEEGFASYSSEISDAVEEYFKYVGVTTGTKDDPETEASMKAKLEFAVDGGKNEEGKDVPGELIFKASCYDSLTFTDPYYMVFFTGDQVDTTPALQAVLNALDPKVAGDPINTINPNNSAILKKDGLFYEWMLAYSKATAGEKAKDIAAIEEWIKKVEEAFVAAEKVAAEPDADFYAEAKEMYDNAVNAVENFETMLADWTAFVGEDYEDKDEYTGKMVPKHRDIKKMDDNMKVNDWMDKVQYIEKVIDGVYTGAWDTTVATGISGQLLKNAQEFLPNLPENVKAWYGVKKEAKDQIKHVEQLQKKVENVFIAAAKLAGYDEDVKKKGEEAAETWDALMKDYKDAQETYVNGLKADIEQAQKDAEDYAKQLANFYEEPSEMGTINNRIYEATIALQQAQMLIEPLTKAKELAKANYDKVLDYIKAQDFTFIDFSNIFDLVDKMFPGVGNDILGKLKGLIMGYLN